MNAASHAWILNGGAWEATQGLPLGDRALRYGMALFETIGVRDGLPMFWDEHMATLRAAAEKLLGQNIGLSSPDLRGEATGVLRVYVTAGDGGPADPVTQPRIFALFEPMPPMRAEEQTARLHPEAVAPFAGGRKTANYWMQCAAQAAAQAAGFDHALLADHAGKLLSGAMGNIFLWLDGKLCTPALSLAVRPGVMRSWVMRQQAVVEAEIPFARLGEAGEVFLTNSRLGVMPLSCGPVVAGPVGAALRDACRQEKIIP